MRLLRDCPGSVLWLLESAPETGANLRREAARHGIDGARLVFARYAETSAHLNRQCHADLFLDTRSEEHTSELQSLMRLSYAVFCLKKKQTSGHYRTTHTT